MSPSQPPLCRSPVTSSPSLPREVVQDLLQSSLHQGVLLDFSSLLVVSSSHSEERQGNWTHPTAWLVTCGSSVGTCLSPHQAFACCLSVSSPPCEISQPQWVQGQAGGWLHGPHSGCLTSERGMQVAKRLTERILTLKWGRGPGQGHTAPRRRTQVPQSQGVSRASLLLGSQLASRGPSLHLLSPASSWTPGQTPGLWPGRTAGPQGGKELLGDRWGPQPARPPVAPQALPVLNGTSVGHN